MSNEMDLNF